MKPILLFLVFMSGAITLSPQLVWCAQPAGLEYKIEGDRLLKQNQLTEAIAHYQKAVETEPESADAYFNLAIAFYLDKKTPQAISALEKVVSIDPSDAEAYYNLGCLLLYEQDTSASLIHFERAKAVIGTNPALFSLINQGIKFLNELEHAPRSTREITLFLLEQGFYAIPLPA